MHHKTCWKLWQLQSFIVELRQLLSAGLPLFSALDLLQTNLNHPQQAALAKQLKQKIAQGISLSTAWQQATQDNLSSALLLAAEKSGLLIEMLKHIEQYATAQQEFRQLIWQALRYPIFLLILTCALLGLLCNWVVPQFAKLYASFNVAMPKLTQFILLNCERIHQHFFAAFLFAIFLIAIIFIFRHHRMLRKIILRLKNYLPMYRHSQELRFWQAVCLLLQAGIPLAQALEICKQVLDDYLMQQKINFLINQLRRGEKLSSSLKQLNCFSAKLITILALAEASGQLTLMLNGHLTQQMLQLQLQLQTFKTWLEPIILMIIGGAIGIVLIALYLPIVELGKWI